MTEEDKRLIEYLRVEHDWSALEIARDLGLQFRRVAAFIEKKGWGPKRFFVGVNVRKAVKADEYWPSN